MLDKTYFHRYAQAIARLDLSVPRELEISMSGYFGFTDYSNEKSGFGVNSSLLTAGNIVAQSAAAATLAVATEALSLAPLTKQTLTNVIVDSPDIPSNPYAQRELKWLVSYQAVVSGKMFTVEIPAPDLTDNIIAGSDVADLTSTDWDAWITAFVGFAKSPDDATDSVIVIGARLVGRNI